MRLGDRLLSSGDGGVYPRGLPVGVAVRGLDGAWRVRLDSDSAPIDYVRILRFSDFSQLADDKALAETPLPPLSAKDAAAVAAQAKVPAVPAPAGAAPTAQVAPGAAPAKIGMRRRNPPGESHVTAAARAPPVAGAPGQ